VSLCLLLFLCLHEVVYEYQRSLSFFSSLFLLNCLDYISFSRCLFFTILGHEGPDPLGGAEIGAPKTQQLYFFNFNFDLIVFSRQYCTVSSNKRSSSSSSSRWKRSSRRKQRQQFKWSIASRAAEAKCAAEPKALRNLPAVSVFCVAQSGQPAGGECLNVATVFA